MIYPNFLVFIVSHAIDQIPVGPLIRSIRRPGGHFLLSYTFPRTIIFPIIFSVPTEQFRVFDAVLKACVSIFSDVRFFCNVNALSHKPFKEFAAIFCTLSFQKILIFNIWNFKYNAMLNNKFHSTYYKALVSRNEHSMKTAKAKIIP